MKGGTVLTPDECKNLDELIATLVKYHPEANVELVEKAYHFAEKRMRGNCANRENLISFIR